MQFSLDCQKLDLMKVTGPYIITNCNHCKPMRTQWEITKAKESAGYHFFV